MFSVKRACGGAGLLLTWHSPFVSLPRLILVYLDCSFLFGNAAGYRVLYLAVRQDLKATGVSLFSRCFEKLGKTQGFCMLKAMVYIFLRVYSRLGL